MYLKFTGARCWHVFRHTFVTNRTGFHELGGDLGQLSIAQLDFTRVNRLMSASGTPIDFQYCRRTIVNVGFRDPLHNSGATVAGGSGWAARRLFASNSPAIGKKNNAVDRLSPHDHRPQGVVQRVPRDPPHLPTGQRTTLR